jgi:hypothetical protein
VNAFLRKTIPPCPKGALGARSSFRIVNALFMRTANDAVCHHYRLDTVRLDHRQNPIADALVETHIGSLRAETLQNFGFCPFGAENSHRDLRGEIGGWSIERDGCDRVSAKSLLRSFLKVIAGRPAHTIPICRVAQPAARNGWLFLSYDASQPFEVNNRLGHPLHENCGAVINDHRNQVVHVIVNLDHPLVVMESVRPFYLSCPLQEMGIARNSVAKRASSNPLAEGFGPDHQSSKIVL